MKSQKSIMGSAMAALAMSAQHRVFGAFAVQRAVTQSMKAARNLEARSKYMPHQGTQEVERRQRAAGVNVARQFNRAVAAGHPTGTLMSRRGRIIAQTA